MTDTDLSALLSSPPLAKIQHLTLHCESTNFQNDDFILDAFNKLISSNQFLTKLFITLPIGGKLKSKILKLIANYPNIDRFGGLVRWDWLCFEIDA